MSIKLTMTLSDWETALKADRITVCQALYYWTELSGKSIAVHMKNYSELVKKYLPLAIWLPVDERFLVHKTNPVEWHSPADFYTFVNTRFGDMLDLGEFLRHYVEEKDPDKAKESLSAKQKQLLRIQRTKDLKATGMSVSEIAKKQETCVKTVYNDLCNNEVYTKELHNSDRVVIRYNMSNYTKPETAALKIRDKFSDEFADALCQALRANSTE